MIVKVVTERRIDRVFDYEVPDFLQGEIQIGHRVRVPFGKKKCTAYVVQICDSSEITDKLKQIIAISDHLPLLTHELVKLAAWVADYYIVPLETVIATMLPVMIRSYRKISKQKLFVSLNKEQNNRGNKSSKHTPLQSHVLEILNDITEISVSELESKYKVSRSVIGSLVKKGLLKLFELPVERQLAAPSFVPSSPAVLNSEQMVALNNIVSGFSEQNPKPRLLFGVTGSGKTEVYLQAISHALQSGRSAIVLVPEIALTPQTIERFRSRFEQLGQRVSVLHSHLSDGERAEQWMAIRRGQSRVVVGTRSAVFAPVNNLGIVVVDEEHDTSYKQADPPRYHGRDVAVARGALEGAVVVLGSATPSLESMFNAQLGKYVLLHLTQRADAALLPKIHLVDMRLEKRIHGPPVFSRRLIDEIHKRLQKREQVILFLNRRGYAPTVRCAACGHVMQCPHCSVPIVYHKHRNVLLCHLCGYQEKYPKQCPACGSGEFFHGGFGTEKAEQVLKEIFPRATVARADSDTLRGKDSHLQLFQDFRTGKIDILLGTQMIAKGLHFPNVTLVGVLHADTALNLPDFRAAERVYQLITQVAGRAGRGEMPGEVFVQTYAPHHTAIQCARKQDWETFYDAEREFRQTLGYPPFKRCTLLTIRSQSEKAAESQANALYDSIKSILPHECDVGRPAPAPIAKLKDFYRWQIFLKYPRGMKVQQHLRPLVIGFSKRRDAVLQCDVDPVFLL